MKTTRTRNRPGPRAELAQTQAQIDAGYLRACDKWGWKKPARCGPLRMAAALALAQQGKAVGN